jgi:hypothetical protein
MTTRYPYSMDVSDDVRAMVASGQTSVPLDVKGQLRVLKMHHKNQATEERP